MIPSITGKLELVYEGEQEGPYQVALKLLGKAIKEEFLAHFPNPNHEEKKRGQDAYGQIRSYFANGKTLDFHNDQNDKSYTEVLNKIPGLNQLITEKAVAKDEKNLFKELILHGLAEFNVLNKDIMGTNLSFSDLLANMLDDMDDDLDGPNFDN